jgi:HTH-type transcriptional regulator/antitoxin HigA
MAIKTLATMPDSYFDLVKKFPLVHIHNDAHLHAAQAVIDRLLTENLDKGAQAYLDVLTDLVETYEKENVEIPDTRGADVLRLLMESNGLSQKQLEKKAGISQSTISAILNGTRDLTVDHMTRLAKSFGVPAAVFLRA